MKRRQPKKAKDRSSGQTLKTKRVKTLKRETFTTTITFPVELRSEIERFILKAREEAGVSYSLAYFCREGAKVVLDRETKILDQAMKGFTAGFKHRKHNT